MSKELQAALVRFLGCLSALIEKEIGEATAASAKTGKGGKKAAPPVEDETETAEDEEQEESADEDMDLGDSDEEQEDEGPKVEDVIKALKKYADKHDRKKAMAVLTKFKVKSVHDLKPADYPKILKMLGA